MTRFEFEPTDQTDIAQNRGRITDTRNRPLAERWWTPDCSDAGSEAFAADWDEDLGGGLPCYGIEPPLQNNFSQPSDPLEKFSFRLHVDGSLEFKGHLDTSLGAVSGTVAVTLPGALPDPPDNEPDFRPAMDQYWHTIVTDDDGITFYLAMVFIDSTSGEVTITWPAL